MSREVHLSIRSIPNPVSEIIQMEFQICRCFARKLRRNLLLKIFNKNNTSRKNLFTLQRVENITLHIKARTNDGGVVLLSLLRPLQRRLKQRQPRTDEQLGFLVGGAVGEDELRPTDAAIGRPGVENLEELFVGVDAIAPEAIELEGPVDGVDALNVVLDGGEKVLLGLRELDVGGELGGVDGGDGHEAVEAGAGGVEGLVDGGGLVVGGEAVVAFVRDGAPDGVDGAGGADEERSGSRRRSSRGGNGTSGTTNGNDTEHY